MAIGNASAFAAEYTPATLRAVAQAVVDRFTAITWSHIGIKGNDAHYGGYHRSLRWCRVSRGRGVDYSDQISRDTSQINTRRKDALRALDITAPPEILIPMCSRVDWAMRHGLLDDVREWYGNDDGNNYVDGYDNFFNTVVTSDDSHLWHLHLSFYTDTVEGPHDRLIAVLLGASGWNTLEDDMLTSGQEGALGRSYQGVHALIKGLDKTPSAGTDKGGEPVWIVGQVRQQTASLAALTKTVQILTDLVNRGGGSVDTAAVLTRIDERAAEDAQRDAEQAARVAELELQLEAYRAAEAKAAQAQADALATRQS